MTISSAAGIGLRWTIGDVNERGFAALRLSLLGAFRIFGRSARFAVYVNTVAVEQALRRVLPLPAELQSHIEWRNSAGQRPRWLDARFSGDGLAEGMVWKFAPLRAFPQLFELALDNDVVFWELPPACRAWLRAAHPGRTLVSEDVASHFGAFASLLPSRPANLGIRGMPPGFDLERALLTVLARTDCMVADANDEQGLQLAALSLEREPDYVALSDVSICSPFPPHIPELGACGAHFVGLNTPLRWNFYGRPADDVRAEHWDRHLPELLRRVGADGSRSGHSAI